MPAAKDLQVAANNLDSLISDWKSSAVKDIISSDDTDRLAEHALHLARVLAYPDLDLKVLMVSC